MTCFAEMLALTKPRTEKGSLFLFLLRFFILFVVVLFFEIITVTPLYNGHLEVASHAEALRARRGKELGRGWLWRG